MGRFLDAAKNRVRTAIEQQKENAAQARFHDEALRGVAKKEAQAAYDQAFIKERMRQARAKGRTAASRPGGWSGKLAAAQEAVRKAQGGAASYSKSYESSLFGSGGGLEVKAPSFEGISGLGTTRKGSKKKSIDDLLL